MKRIFDFLMALLCIIIFSIPMVIVAVVIFFRMGKPILFKQERPGLNEKPFQIYKFRTMTNERDDYNNLLPNEKRLTPLGRTLRQMSLDELPQLFNVLKGELSLVGPRPLRMDYLKIYTPEQARRHEVPPGITGWAQVNGRNNIGWEERFELDLWYVNNHSFLLDMKILFRTFTTVFKRKDIQPENKQFVEKFKGSKKDEL